MIFHGKNESSTAGSQTWNVQIPNLLATHGIQELHHQSPSTPCCFPKLPKSSGFGCAFPQQHRVLKSFTFSMFGSARSTRKWFRLKGWFFMIFCVCCLVDTCSCLNLFCRRMEPTYYPSIKSIAQQPLIFTHREVFPRLCEPNFVEFLPPNKMGTT